MNSAAFVYNRRLWFVIAGVLSWMGFHFWLLHYRFGVSREMALIDSLVTNVLTAGTCMILVNLLLHYVPSIGKFWFALVSAFFLSLFSALIMESLLSPLSEGEELYRRFLSESYPVRWAFVFVACTGVSISGIFQAEYKSLLNQLAREESIASMVKEAELQKLQLQLQPHFLFNCLNSVNSLIITRPEEARKMVQRLSDFLRITLRRADQHWISLGEEWEYLQLYLDIEKVRFGHRLNIEVNFKDSSPEWKIPTLLLQPLVENAIKFGLYGTTGTVAITLDASVKGQYLELVVANPYDPDAIPEKGNGFGLRGLQRRLYLLFARNDLLLTQTHQNTFSVTLKIPPQP